jgi:hypothetical protein
MTPVAYVYVKRPSGATYYFVADECEIKDGLVTASGQFRTDSGRLEPRRSYTWPARRIVEIQWTREAATA